MHAVLRIDLQALGAVVAGGIGCDWDRDAVLAAVDKATDVTWRRSAWHGHELAITHPDHFREAPFLVGVTRPAPAEES